MPIKLPRDPGKEQNGNKSGKPIKSIRIGLLTASIWKRTGQHGDFYNTAVQRSYKDGEDWKYSDSFGREDLLTASKLLDLAHSWIIKAEAEARQE